MRAKLALVAVAMSALAACDSRPAPEINGPAPGRWRITTTLPHPPVLVEEHCYPLRNVRFDPQKQTETLRDCKEVSGRREGDLIDGHSVCTRVDKDRTVTTDMRIRGDLGTRYTTETITRMDPPPLPDVTEIKVTSVYERLGDC
jgi:hypothetical protein